MSTFVLGRRLGRYPTALFSDGGKTFPLFARPDLAMTGGAEFDWGEYGPGAIVLSASILAKATQSDEVAALLCHDFAEEVVSLIPHGGIEFDCQSVWDWCFRHPGFTEAIGLTGFSDDRENGR